MSKNNISSDLKVRSGAAWSSAPRLRLLLGLVVIVVAVFFAYYPSINGNFILDDDRLLTNNILIKSPDGLDRFWRTTKPDDYWPATYTALWIEWRLWANNPTGYHVANMMLHIAESLLIWIVLRKLSVPGAFLAAVIFAVHPVNVESVAWISQRKNVLAMLFFLLSILWYLKADIATISLGMAPESKSFHGGPRERENSRNGPRERGNFKNPEIAKLRVASIESQVMNVAWNQENALAYGSRLNGEHDFYYLRINKLIPNFQSLIPIWYWLSLAAFVLAIFSKGSTVVLPALLLGIIWWMRSKGGVPGTVTISAGDCPNFHEVKMGLFPFKISDIFRVAPFFLVAIILAAVNVWFQTHGSGEVLRNAGFLERLLGAGGVVWYYFYKAILPIDLAFVYPQWHVQVGNPLWWAPLLAALTVTAVLWRYRASWGRPFLFAWGYFCTALLPVMGFIDVGFMRYSLVADHYQHIAIIGIIALTSAGWSAWHSLVRVKAAWQPVLVAVAAAAVFAFLTCRQNEIYSDAVTLYRAALHKNPRFWMGRGNLAYVLYKAGQTQDAIEQYEKALELNSEYFEAQSNLGAILIQEGRPEQAIEHCLKAVSLKPNRADTHYNLGNAYKAAGLYPRAIEAYAQAIRMKSDFMEAYFNLALAYAEIQKSPEAIDAGLKALEIARSKKQPALVKKIEDWLNNYRAAVLDKGL
jgi:tetratricopeptide (TPR) repeat protein